MDAAVVGKTVGGISASVSTSQPLRNVHSSNGLSIENNVTSGTNGQAAGEASVSLTKLQEIIKAQKEWVKYIIFDGDATILLSNMKPLEGEVAGFLKLYNKREDTIMSGIVLLNEQYDVHRFHPPLVYGRRGDPSVEEGEGIAMCKVVQGHRMLYCLITYVYPTLSARAVPQLKEFCETQCELIE
ncbi:unnamed protein product [Peronospora farinosa]|uniref:Profilin n=1 Tax=Peronospora farinosa TaxID=134698 RepID=A0AAV0U773_9STRA|nr:unnamed protein product [Peronospora farinosa]CAI5731760.1 unnamed protein product [Peronospora farinosa]